MKFEQVLFAFFIVLALTLNFGFFYGEIDNPDHHNVYEMYAALVVSLVATILKFGDRSQYGPVFLATSLVADLQLIAAAIVWGIAENMSTGLSSHAMAAIVSLSGGALLANVTSMILLLAETMSMSMRR